MRVEISVGIVYDRVEVRVVGEWILMADDLRELLVEFFVLFISCLLGVCIDCH